MGTPKYCTNRKSAGEILSTQFVRAVLKLGWGGSGEPLKCPDEMGLIVVIMVNMFF